MSKPEIIKKYDLPFLTAYDLQKKCAEDVIKNNKMFIILTSHPHVITYGLSENGENLKVSENFLKETNIELVKTDRGGKATYHGPGQLVCYPIINLKNFSLTVKDYVALLEQAIIETLLEFKITACTKKEHIAGIWTNNKKIASIGIRVKDGISMHGISLNINTDLSYFNYINPCGLPSDTMTSMKEILGHEIELDEVADVLTQKISSKLNS